MGKIVTDFQILTADLYKQIDELKIENDKLKLELLTTISALFRIKDDKYSGTALFQNGCDENVAHYIDRIFVDLGIHE